MANKYVEDLKKEISKYYYTSPNADYVSILIHCFNGLENIKEDGLTKEELEITKNKILSIIFEVTRYIEKSDFKYYISILKKLQIYKYKQDKISRIFLKYFTSIFVNLHSFKYKIHKFSKYRAYKNVFYLSSYMIPYPKKNFKSKKLYIPYTEVVITTKCTLRCKNCANLICNYKKPYNVDKEIVIKSIKKLTKSCSEVAILRILGGEPFCNPDLKYIINSIPENKVREIVIVTNGTLVPTDKELLHILQKKNVRVEISDYNEYSYKKNELIETLVYYDIFYTINKNENWFDYGDPVKYDKTSEELDDQFSNCNILCRSILNGRLYYCPRSAHGYDLGIIKPNKDEYVDLLRNGNMKNKKQIKALFNRKKSIEACKYCKYATKDCKLIKVAQQIKG